MRKYSTLFLLATFVVGVFISLYPARAQAAPPLPPVFEREWGNFDLRFSTPKDIAIDADGFIYTVEHSDRVQKFTRDGELVTSWGSYGNGNGQFDNPSGIATDSAGNVYVADTNNQRIQKFTPDGTYIKQLGSSGSDSGQFTDPQGLAIDSEDNLYVADSGNQRIQKLDGDGGYLAQFGTSGEGEGQFSSPRDIAIDSKGNLYVVDQGNDRIQKFDSDGNFLLMWGSSGTDQGEFYTAVGIAVDSQDNIYVSDDYRHYVQKFSSDGTYLARWGSYGSGSGQFDNPNGMAVDDQDNLYIVDRDNDRVQVFTKVGGYLRQYGAKREDQMDRPHDVTIDSEGNIYVVEYFNNRIQKFTPDGKPLDMWGSSGSGNGQFDGSINVAVDSNDNLYIADHNNHRIQKFDSSGNYLDQWGSYGTGNGQFDRPHGIGIDSTGNIYVVDYGNHRIQKFDSSGKWVKSWGSNGTSNGQFSSPKGIAVDSHDNIYVADTSNRRVQKFTSDGGFLTKWGSYGTGDGLFKDPTGLTVDREDNVYVADYYNDRVQKFTSDGVFLTKWGSEGSGDGQFDTPTGLTVDREDNVYVADNNNDRVQKFVPALGIIGPRHILPPTDYDYTAHVRSPAATSPITFTWNVAGFSKPVNITDYLTDTRTFSWDTTGEKQMEVVARESSDPVHEMTSTLFVNVWNTKPLEDLSAGGKKLLMRDGEQQTFTAVAHPFDAGKPVEFTWSAPGAQTEDITESLDSYTSTQKLSWSYPGRKQVVVTATNQSGVEVFDSFEVEIFKSLETVSVTGPYTSQEKIDRSYTAEVTPGHPSRPINFIWEATDHERTIISQDALTHTQTFNWDTKGTKLITMTASNVVGSVVVTKSVEVERDIVEPTYFYISGTSSGNTKTEYTYRAYSVSPSNVELPLTYEWKQDGVVVATNVVEDTEDSITLSWDTPGEKTVEVTVRNLGGQVVKEYGVTISIVAPSSVSISGDTSGYNDTDHTYTATVYPSNAEQPLTYEWKKDGTVVATHEVNGTEDSVTLNWDSPGEKAVEVTVTNAGGSVVDSHTVNISVIKPSRVTIDGPTEGQAGATYVYTATAEPADAELPLTYEWKQDDVVTATHEVNGLSDNVSLSWATEGSKKVEVTVSNASGQVIDSHTTVIEVGVEGVTLTGPTEGYVGTSYDFELAVKPDTASTRIDCFWDVTDKTDSSQWLYETTLTKPFEWSEAGEKTIEVTVNNDWGTATAKHTILIEEVVSSDEKIAFHSRRGSNTDIYVVNADGENEWRFTTDINEDTYPAWSPDGTKLLFVSDRDGNEEIYIANADGSEQTNLTNNKAADSYPTWSADGSTVVFASDRGGNWDIYKMGVDGAGQQTLTSDATDEIYPSVSPDSGQIAFATDINGNWDIYVMEADGTGRTALMSDAGIDSYPSWSPDGTKIAFHTDRNGEYDIYTMNADGSGLTNVTESYDADAYDPVWSPDGTKIAFDSFRNESLSIYTINADGADFFSITGDWYQDEYPSWSIPNTASGDDGSGGSLDEGGDVEVGDGTEVSLPPDAVSEEVTDIVYTSPIDTPSPLPSDQVAMRLFRLHALMADGTTITSLSKPVTITLRYTSDEVINTGVDEQTLSILAHDGSAWNGIDATFYNETNQFQIATDTLGDFAIVGSSVTQEEEEGCQPTGDDTPSPQVWSTDPARGVNYQSHRLKVQGKDFVSSALVFFRDQEGKKYKLTDVSVSSGDEVLGNTPLLPVGIYDVVVQNPDCDEGTMYSGYESYDDRNPQVITTSPTAGGAIWKAPLSSSALGLRRRYGFWLAAKSWKPPVRTIPVCGLWCRWARCPPPTTCHPANVRWPRDGD